MARERERNSWADAARHRAPRLPGMPPRNGRVIGLAVKRAIDIVGASAALALLSPVLLWTSVAVLVYEGPPILFRQERPGWHERPFRMYKFRTMRSPRPGERWYETDDRRVTRLGRVLRSTSIDELPELWNVLRGEMSLVGPRPLLIGYLNHYTADERRRHEMRPGVTGWAAVHGRHTLRFEDRLALDTWYVDNWSLRLDLAILAKTASQVLRGTDAAPTQDLVMVEFPSRFEDGRSQQRIDGTKEPNGG